MTHLLVKLRKWYLVEIVHRVAIVVVAIDAKRAMLLLLLLLRWLPLLLLIAATLKYKICQLIKKSIKYQNKLLKLKRRKQT